MTRRPPPTHGDRRGIVHDGAIMAGLTAVAVAARIRFHDEIDPWAHPIADALTPPTLGLLTLSYLALWVVMAVKGATTPVERWTARFMFSSFLTWAAVLTKAADWPLLTLTLIAVLIWSAAGLIGATTGRYVGQTPWWVLALAIVAVLAVAAVLH